MQLVGLGNTWILTDCAQKFARTLRATSHTRLKARDHCNLRALIGRRAYTTQIHFTHEGEGLKVQRRLMDE